MLTFFTSLLVHLFLVLARLTPEELEDKLQEWPEGVKSNVWMNLEVINANQVGVLASDFKGYLLASRQPADSGFHCYKYRHKLSHIFLFDRKSPESQGITPIDIALWKKLETAYVEFFYKDKAEFDALMCGQIRDQLQSSMSSSAHSTLGEAVFGSTNSSQQRVVVRSYRANIAELERCGLLPVPKRPELASRFDELDEEELQESPTSTSLTRRR
jgi:hypothetical protein